MKILVTGSSGMIGSELKKYAPAGTLFFAYKEEPALDILDYAKAREIVVSNKPDIIIHLAAQTNVDLCEKNPQECHNVNVKGTQNLVNIAKEIDSVFVYPSTFYVYGGGKKDYYDDRIDQPDINSISSVYAKSKLMSEEAVCKSLKKYFILRLGALFGGGKKDKKFVGKIFNLIKTQKEIRVVSDRIVQPSSVQDSVKNMLALMQTNKYGTYNMVGYGSASYYEYAKAIVEYSGAKGIKIIPIKSADFKEDAPRESNLSVINGKLQDIGLDLMRDWKVALKDYISEIKKEGLI